MKSLARWGLGNTSVRWILTLSLSSPVSFDNPFLLSISDYVPYCSIQENNSFLVSCPATILFLRHNCTFCLWTGPFSSPGISFIKPNMLPIAPFFFKINTTYFSCLWSELRLTHLLKMEPDLFLKRVTLDQHCISPFYFQSFIAIFFLITQLFQVIRYRTSSFITTLLILVLPR